MGSPYRAQGVPMGCCEPRGSIVPGVPRESVWQRSGWNLRDHTNTSWLICIGFVIPDLRNSRFQNFWNFVGSWNGLQFIPFWPQSPKNIFWMLINIFANHIFQVIYFRESGNISRQPFPTTSIDCLSRSNVSQHQISISIFPSKISRSSYFPTTFSDLNISQQHFVILISPCNISILIFHNRIFIEINGKDGRSHILYSLMTCLTISCARHGWQHEWLARPFELRHTRGGGSQLQRLYHSVTVIILPDSPIPQFPVHGSCSSIYILIRFWGVLASFGVAWSKRFFIVCFWISIYAPCELARPFQFSFCFVVWRCLPIIWLMAGFCCLVGRAAECIFMLYPAHHKLDSCLFIRFLKVSSRSECSYTTLLQFSCVT